MNDQEPQLPTTHCHHEVAAKLKAGLNGFVSTEVLKISTFGNTRTI